MEGSQPSLWLSFDVAYIVYPASEYQHAADFCTDDAKEDTVGRRREIVG